MLCRTWFVLIFIFYALQSQVLAFKIQQGQTQSKSALQHTKNNEKGNIATSEVFSLDSVRSTLIRQEETIIFALIERAQYRQNSAIYDTLHHNLKNPKGEPISFFDWMLIETENLHAKVRRFTSPEEHPFFPEFLVNPILPVLVFPGVLKETPTSRINVNSEVMKWYVNSVVKKLCNEGDDEQHGSSVICDIAAVQALSRRVHFGKFVAESKFLQDPEKYTELVRKNDVKGILGLLTNTEVERKVLRRSFLKASTYGQDISGGNAEYNSKNLKLEPMLIAELYRDMIISLTKDVEVRYLYQRVGAKPPSQETYFQMCKGPMDAFDGIDINSLDDVRRNF